jgi:hypothetical protein
MKDEDLGALLPRTHEEEACGSIASAYLSICQHRNLRPLNGSLEKFCLLAHHNDTRFRISAFGAMNSEDAGALVRTRRMNSKCDQFWALYPVWEQHPSPEKMEVVILLYLCVLQIYALLFNPYFTEICCDSGEGLPLVRSLIEVLVTNGNIKKLQASRIGWTSNLMVEFCSKVSASLKKRGEMMFSLTHIDVSGNPLEDKGLEAFAQLVATLPYGEHCVFHTPDRCDGCVIPHHLHQCHRFGAPRCV